MLAPVRRLRSPGFRGSVAGQMRGWLPSVGLLALALVVCEGALQLASLGSLTVRRLLAPPWRTAAVTVGDARLVTRGNPLHREHDSAGYNNPVRLPRADIVVLGDSHSYGRNAWPRLVGRQLGRSVYNMAMPAHGPGQNLLQLDETLALQPRLVIVAPYFGNDLYDTYVMTRRHPSLAAGLDTGLVEAAAVAERRMPLAREAAVLFLAGGGPTPTVSSVRAWASERVALYGLIRAARARLVSPEVPGILSRDFGTAAVALTSGQRSHASALDAGDWRTILTSAYRGRVLDDTDPRIRVGFEGARAALMALHEGCRARGVALLVVLLPTKESVFHPRVHDAAAHPGLQQLVTNETRLRGELTATFLARGIAHVDPLDALRSAGTQPYFEDIDGHPNQAGHDIIAAVVGARARQLLP